MFIDIARTAHAFVTKHIKVFEITGVLMRVSSFSLVSWMGSESPFALVWIVNTTDAILLSWCSTIKKDTAYIILNFFWVLVGVVGIARAFNFGH